MRSPVKRARRTGTVGSRQNAMWDACLPPASVNDPATNTPLSTAASANAQLFSPDPTAAHSFPSHREMKFTVVGVHPEEDGTASSKYPPAYTFPAWKAME